LKPSRRDARHAPGIRDSRLYRIEHGTFEEYCKSKWGFTKTQANRLIGGSEVAKNVTPIGVSPKTESQSRPLTKLPAEKQPEAWEKSATAAVIFPANQNASNRPPAHRAEPSGVRPLL